MRYRVRHVTEYVYGAPVTLCYNMAHLLPRDTHNQTCISRRLHVAPTPIYQTEGEDYYGNPTYYFSIQEPHKKLTIDVECLYEVSPLELANQLTLGSITCGELRQLLAESSTPELRMTKEFLLNSPLIQRAPDLASYAEEAFADHVPVLQAALDFTHKIFNEFTFDPTATSVSTPVAQVLKEKRGVCQDFAHLAIACIRSVGLPARYISGYLETLPPPGQEKLVGADASHAWFAIYIPEMGWVEFDPTNDLMPSDQHIVTAWGRDYSDVTPLQGVIFDGGDSQNIKVSVDVQRC